MTAYSDLQSRVADWLNRSDITSSQIDTFIGLAEARFNRRLIVPEREAVATAVASDEVIALPADFWAMRAIRVASSQDAPLKQMSVVELRRSHAGAAAGAPRHYAIVGNALLLGPAPAEDTDIVLDYFATIPALGPGNPSNWVTRAYPDLYLAGVLAEAYIFLRDTEGADLWDSRTEAKIAEIEKAGRRKYAGAAPLVQRGPGPSIRGVRA